MRALILFTLLLITCPTNAEQTKAPDGTTVKMPDGFRQSSLDSRNGQHHAYHINEEKKWTITFGVYPLKQSGAAEMKKRRKTARSNDYTIFVAKVPGAVDVFKCKSKENDVIQVHGVTSKKRFTLKFYNKTGGSPKVFEKMSRRVIKSLRLPK